jgi:hypothetical protein
LVVLLIWYEINYSLMLHSIDHRTFIHFYLVFKWDGTLSAMKFANKTFIVSSARTVFSQKYLYQYLYEPVVPVYNVIKATKRLKKKPHITLTKP